MITHNANTIMLTQTTVAPTGVEIRMDKMIPNAAQNTPITPEAITTDKKLLKILSDDKTGNTTNAEIRREPTSCMLNTITTAIITERSSLYRLHLMPVAEAKLSSNVTEKIR